MRRKVARMSSRAYGAAARAGVLALAFLLLVLAGPGCRPASPGRAKAQGQEVLRIGMALGRADPEKGSFDALAREGLEALARELGGRFVGEGPGPDYGDRVEIRWLGSRVGPGDYAQVLQALVDSGSGLVFACGQAWSESLTLAARRNPATHFVLLDAAVQDQGSLPNLTRLAFSEEESAFLAGALAGAYVRANPKARLGFLGGQDPAANQARGAGFVAGATYTNPNLRRPGMILVQAPGKDARPKADIVYYASGEVCRLTLGPDQDLSREEGSLLASSRRQPEGLVLGLAKEYAQTRTVKAGHRVLGLGAGAVDLALGSQSRDRLGPLMPELEGLRARIISGELRVPRDESTAGDFAKALR